MVVHEVVILPVVVMVVLVVVVLVVVVLVAAVLVLVVVHVEEVLAGSLRNGGPRNSRPLSRRKLIYKTYVPDVDDSRCYWAEPSTESTKKLDNDTSRKRGRQEGETSLGAKIAMAEPRSMHTRWCQIRFQRSFD